MQQYSFFLWAAVILLGVVLAGFAPKKGVRQISLGAASLACLGFLVHLDSGWLVLGSFTLGALILTYFAAREPTFESRGSKPTPPEILLHWIIVGSLLLILATVLRKANWRPRLADESLTTSKLWSGYGFLLVPTLLFAVVWTLLRKGGKVKA